jgi:hypothetical protein
MFKHKKQQLTVITTDMACYLQRKKSCGACGALDVYDERASYCIHCGKRALDYTCGICGRKHVGGMACQCEPDAHYRYDMQYNTRKLEHTTIAEFHGEVLT